MAKATKYSEPTDFIPKNIRKQNNLGEFSANTGSQKPVGKAQTQKRKSKNAGKS